MLKTIKWPRDSLVRWAPLLAGLTIALAIGSLPAERTLLLELGDVTDFHRDLMLPNPAEFSAPYIEDNVTVRDIKSLYGTVLVRSRAVVYAEQVDALIRVKINQSGVEAVRTALIKGSSWPTRWTSLYNPYQGSLGSLPLVAQEGSLLFYATSPVNGMPSQSFGRALSGTPSGARIATNAWNLLASFPESTAFPEPTFNFAERFPHPLASPPTGPEPPGFLLGGSFRAITYLERNPLEITVHFTETSVSAESPSRVAITQPQGDVLAEAHYQNGLWEPTFRFPGKFLNGTFTLTGLPRGVYSVAIEPASTVFIKTLGSNQPKFVLEAPFRLVPVMGNAGVSAFNPVALYTLNYNRKFMRVNSLDVGFPYEVKLLQEDSGHQIGVWLPGEDYYAFLERGETVVVAEKPGILVETASYFSLDPERFFLPMRFDWADLTGGLEEVIRKADFVFLDYSEPIDEGTGWYVLRASWARTDFASASGRLTFVLQIVRMRNAESAPPLLTLDKIHVRIQLQNLWSRIAWPG